MTAVINKLISKQLITPPSFLKNSIQYDKMKVSYGVYSTSYDVPYVYCVANSSVVQNMNFRLDKDLN